MNRALRVELLLVVLFASTCAAAVPLATGFLAWSWDAMNHHVYLGMTAEHPRWHLDVLAASVQSYQYPYPYWPVYRLSLLSGSGAWLGALWSATQAALLVVPVWLVSLRLLAPGSGNALEAAMQRLAACTLALMSAVVLIGLETTASDILAAVPLIWAVAVALAAPPTTRQAWRVGALFGLSVALKLSNGIFLPLLLFWWWQPARPWLPLRRGVALAGGATLGFALPYAPWGWQLWQQTGNPFHPFLGQWFSGG